MQLSTLDHVKLHLVQMSHESSIQSTALMSWNHNNKQGKNKDISPCKITSSREEQSLCNGLAGSPFVCKHRP